MISKEHEFFIRVLSDFINGRTTERIASIDWVQIFNHAQNHQVAGIIYYQCKGIVDDQVILKKLISQYSSSLYNSVNVKKNYTKISQELTNKGISYVPVKGLQIAALYPIPELRTMGDIDILAHGNDFDIISQVFIEQGYKFGKKTQHEITFRKNQFYYEVHEFMINKPKGEDEIQKSFYNNYWNYLVTPEKKGELELNWSFHFLFLLQHMRQHILWEGIGFRQFIDMAFVIQRTELDWEFILCATKKINLYDFLLTVLSFVDRWFNIKAPVDIPELGESFFKYATNKVFDDGVFGFSNDENIINEFQKEYSESEKTLLEMKVRFLIYVLFPSYARLRNVKHYRLLDGRPYLLPVVWMYRIFYTIKHIHYTNFEKSKRIVFVDKKNLDKRRSDIEMWGL